MLRGAVLLGEFLFSSRLVVIVSVACWVRPAPRVASGSLPARGRPPQAAARRAGVEHLCRKSSRRLPSWETSDTPNRSAQRVTSGRQGVRLWHTTLRAEVEDALCLVELRGFEPLTPCMPLMLGWFTTPCNTSRVHITAQVRNAAEGWVVGRREVTCSAVSGKSLARDPTWSFERRPRTWECPGRTAPAVRCCPPGSARPRPRGMWRGCLHRCRAPRCLILKARPPRRRWPTDWLYSPTATSPSRRPGWPARSGWWRPPTA